VQKAAPCHQVALSARRYLTSVKKVAPQGMVIYGHSLDGAVAIGLGVPQPDAAGVIVASRFTSIHDAAARNAITVYLRSPCSASIRSIHCVKFCL
jgi:hypothetical protein